MTQAPTGTPAFCFDCGWRGRSPDLFGGSSDGVTIEGVALPCPRCGGRARALDGTWDVADSSFTLVDGPPDTIKRLVEILTDERWDTERLRMLDRALKSTARGGSDEHRIEQVARIDPELGGHLKQWLRRPEVGNAAGIVGAVAAVVAIILSLGQGPEPLTPAQTRQIVHEELERHPIEVRVVIDDQKGATKTPPPQQRKRSGGARKGK